jgi:hypothetical protein
VISPKSRNPEITANRISLSEINSANTHLPILNKEPIKLEVIRVLKTLKPALNVALSDLLMLKPPLIKFIQTEICQ